MPFDLDGTAVDREGAVGDRAGILLNDDKRSDEAQHHWATAAQAGNVYSMNNLANSLVEGGSSPMLNCCIGSQRRLDMLLQ